MTNKTDETNGSIILDETNESKILDETNELKVTNESRRNFLTTTGAVAAGIAATVSGSSCAAVDSSCKEKQDIEGLQGPSAKSISEMKQQGRKVMLMGRIKDGKVEIDQSSLDRLAREFPNSNMAFVAVNAPFDPVSRTI